MKSPFDLAVDVVLEANPQARNPRIRITFQTTTEDSARRGDYAKQGWKDKKGVSMTPDAYDIADGKTVVDKAVEFLQTEGVMEASSSQFGPNLWYSTEPQMDPSTGEERSQSYHLVDFTPEEAKAIYDRLGI